MIENRNEIIAILEDMGKTMRFNERRKFFNKKNTEYELRIIDVINHAVTQIKREDLIGAEAEVIIDVLEFEMRLYDEKESLLFQYDRLYQERNKLIAENQRKAKLVQKKIESMQHLTDEEFAIAVMEINYDDTISEFQREEMIELVDSLRE